MLGEWKVVQVEGGWKVFWYPQAPLHYQDSIPVDDQVYTKKQAAYARKKRLEEELAKRMGTKPEESAA